MVRPSFVPSPGLLESLTHHRVFVEVYGAPANDPETSPLLFTPRDSLPPLVVFISGLDPLADEDLLYARLSREAGVRTRTFM